MSPLLDGSCSHMNKQYIGAFFFSLRPKSILETEPLQLEEACSSRTNTWSRLPLCVHTSTHCGCFSYCQGELYFVMRDIDGQSESPVPCHWFHQAGHFWEPSRALSSRNIRPYPEMAYY